MGVCACGIGEGEGGGVCVDGGDGVSNFELEQSWCIDWVYNNGVNE